LSFHTGRHLKGNQEQNEFDPNQFKAANKKRAASKNQEIMFKKEESKHRKKVWTRNIHF